jgi:hypothetical protein
MAKKQPSFRVKIVYLERGGAEREVQNKFWITARDAKPSPADGLTIPIYTVQDGIDLAKKQFKEHLAIHGAVWISLTVIGPGSTKVTHRETNPDAEKEQAKAQSGANDGPSEGKYQGNELQHYTMAYHGALRRSAHEVEADHKSLAEWVESQRQGGADMPNWKLARLQGYADALAALGGCVPSQPQAARKEAPVSAPTDEIRRDYVKFNLQTDKELLDKYGYGAPDDSGDKIRRAAVQNLVAAYARVTGLSLKRAEEALIQYEAQSRTDRGDK